MLATTSAFIWSKISGHLINVAPIFTLLLASFCSPLTPEGNTALLSSSVYVQLSFICLSFGGEQVQNQTANQPKQLSFEAVQIQNSELKDAKALCRAEGKCGVG